MADQTTDNNESQPLIPGLPNDVAIQCIARVPRSHHPHVSLVSKSWHTTLKSPHFHATRRALNSTESHLFLNLRIFNPKDSTFTFHWHFLDPSRTFRRIPSPSTCHHPIGSSCVALSHKLYVIGGCVGDVASSDLWVYDCLERRWEVGPRMRVGREFAAAGVVGGRVYVIGGCVVDNWARSVNWAEVYDPGTAEWAAVPSAVEVREKWMHGSAVVGGRVYAMADRGGVVFDPGSGEWGPVSTELDLGWRGRAAVVDGVLYCYDYLGKIRGFDVVGDVWRELRGVGEGEGLPRFLCGATMANVGGRLFVVWEGKGKEIEVHCAEIAVRKDGEGELWGSIVWSGVITVIPKGSSIVHCLGMHL